MAVQRLEKLAEFERVSPALVERAKAYTSTILCDVAGRRGSLHGRVQPLAPSMKIAGPAFTVEARPGDNLGFHLALAVARPGDVLVVDGKGDLGSALFGDLMVTQAQAADLAGLVVDGAVRDTNELIARGYPIFAAGRNPAGPTKGIPGRLSIPICVAGAPVNPGDLVVGDADGVVVIPRNDVETVLVAAAKKLAEEQQRLKEIAEGSLISPWLDDALRAAGVISGSESIL
jgi:4-hydroxy-4-methyl-2-oxoglutarate aldolase